MKYPFAVKAGFFTGAINIICLAIYIAYQKSTAASDIISLAIIAATPIITSITLLLGQKLKGFVSASSSAAQLIYCLLWLYISLSTISIYLSTHGLGEGNYLLVVWFLLHYLITPGALMFLFARAFMVFRNKN